MDMDGARAYGKYRRMQVNTATPGQLVLMLYEAGSRWAREGAAALSQGAGAGARLLVKAQDAVTELTSGLNREGGGCWRKICGLYEYMHRRLVEANINKDPEPAREAAAMLSELKEVWTQAVRDGNTQLKAAGGLNVGG